MSSGTGVVFDDNNIHLCVLYAYAGCKYIADIFLSMNKYIFFYRNYWFLFLLIGIHYVRFLK